MNTQYLDPYVFLTITESSYRIITKKKTWNNNQWCEHISKHLNGQVNAKNIINILLPVFDDLEDMYCFNRAESVRYVLKYFKGKEWVNYMPLIVANKKYYGIEMY